MDSKRTYDFSPYTSYIFSLTFIHQCFYMLTDKHTDMLITILGSPIGVGVINK